MSETTAKHEGRRKLPSRRVQFLLALFVGFALFYAKYSAPEGMWDIPSLGNEGYAYLEFRNGRFEFAVEEEKAGPELLGAYQLEDGKWVVTSKSGDKLYAQASPWTLRIIDKDGKPILPPLKRLFFRPKPSLAGKVKPKH
jgi:hypothetical protein